jgi:hypothetical protein
MTMARWARTLVLPAELRGSEIFDASRAEGVVWMATSRGPARLAWTAESRWAPERPCRRDAG